MEPNETPNEQGSTLENVLSLVDFSIRQLAEIQATRHPVNGRHASLAITHLEEARYRIQSIFTQNFIDQVGQEPLGVDEKPTDQ